MMGPANQDGVVIRKTSTRDALAIDALCLALYKQELGLSILLCVTPCLCITTVSARMSMFLLTAELPVCRETSLLCLTALDTKQDAVVGFLCL